MKKRLVLLLCIGLVIVGIGWMVSRYVQSSSPRRSVTPDEAGLVWRECLVAQAFYRDQATECFRHPMPMPLGDATDKMNSGELVGGEGEDLYLTIGQNVYRTILSDGGMTFQQCYTLYRDQDRLYSLCGLFTTHSPNIALQAVGGQVAWEFADHRLDTIIYDGQDLRTVYDLDGSYRPYNLGDKLIFVGKKDGKYFVIYDGRRVGPDYDEIVIAYC